MSTVSALCMEKGVGLPKVWQGLPDPRGPDPLFHGPTYCVTKNLAYPTRRRLVDLTDHQTALGAALKLDEWERASSEPLGYWMLSLARVEPGGSMWIAIVADMAARIVLIADTDGYDTEAEALVAALEATEGQEVTDE